MKRLVTLLAYAAPFLAVMAWDWFILGRAYYLVPNDSLTSMYGLGLNWLTLDPWPSTHHPDYFFQQITAPLVLLSGIGRTTLASFTVITTLVQAATAFLAGWWVSILASRLRLGVFQVFCIGVASAAMPQMLVGATTWGHYFPVGVFLPPLGLAMLVLFGRERDAASTVTAAMFVLGFLTANYFVILALCAPVGLLIAYQCLRDPADKIAAWLGESRGRILWHLALFLFVALNLVFPLYKLIWRAPTYALDWRAMSGAIALSVLGAAIFYLAFRLIEPRLGKWNIVLRRVASPLLWGWLVGNNVMSVFWLTTAATVFLTKRGQDAPVSLPANAWTSALSPAWNAIIVLAIVIPALLALASPRRNAFLLVFCAGSTALSVLISWQLFISSPAEPGMFGLASRYLMPALAANAALYAALQQKGRLIARASSAGLLLIAGVTFAQAVLALGPATRQARAANTELERAIEGFLTRHPGGSIVCVNAEAPEVCSALYAWNRYRKPESLPKIAPPAFMGGRAFYAQRDCDTANGLACATPETKEPVALVLSEPLPATAKGTLLAQPKRFGAPITIFVPAGQAGDPK